MSKIQFTVMTAVIICASPMVTLAGGPVPVVPEPSTYITGTLCLAPMAIGLIAALRKPRK